MSIQIFGTKKCKTTKKAERFFKERRIAFHFVDLNQKGLSKGELNKIKQSVDLDELMDKEGKEYQKRNLKYMVHDPEEELLKHPLLLKTPIVRFKGKATVGYQPDTWKSWQAKD